MRPPSSIAVCAYCDAVHARVTLPAGAQAQCATCGSPLYADPKQSAHVWLALLLASAIVFLIANLNPIVELELRGESTRASLLGALVATWHAGAAPVAMLAALCAFVFPMLVLGIQLHVLGFLMAGTRPPAFATALGLLRLMRPWSMVEVFMVGVLVSVAKLGKQMTVIAGPGIAAFAVLTVLLTLLSRFDPDPLWDWADRTDR